MSDVNINLDMTKYPTLVNFTQSPEYIRMIIGPAGSMKTSWCFNEILKFACAQEPDAFGVRSTRWCVVRNTYQVLKDSTLRTAKNILGVLNSGLKPNEKKAIVFIEGTLPKARASFELPDGTTVEFEIDFLAVDSVDVVGKLLGYEFTGCFLDEVSELPKEVVLAAARRAGRYPFNVKATWYGLFGATNGPKEDHWLYDWSMGGDEEFKKLMAEIESKMDRPFFKLFQQPPALLRPDKDHPEWRENPLAENVHNLPGGYAYYFAMLAGSDPEIQAYVEGQFAKLVTGTLVFKEFSVDWHVIDDKDLPPVAGHDLVLGADFGRTPAVLLGAEAADGTLYITDEVLGTDVSIDKLIDELLKPVLTQRYKGSTVSEAWGDPAGSIKGQANELSPFEVMNQKGIPITAALPNNQYAPRLDAVRYYLERVGSNGKPKIRIAKRCVYLIKSLGYNYIYEKTASNSTITKDTPTKSHIGWVSDVSDALQYLCLGLRLRGVKPKRDKGFRPKKKKNRV